MASKPNLRLATFNVPIFCEIVEINGKPMLRGLSIFRNIVQLFVKAGFNVSLVPADEQATGISDENGTYNGLYGAVQSGVSVKFEKYVQTSEIVLKKADTSIVNAPIRLAQSIGQLTPVIMDTANIIGTKREPVQVYHGTLFDCLTTLGPLNNLLLGAIVALILIFLSVSISKHASWNFFAQLMTENFVPFRPLSLKLTFMAALSIVRALFGSAYSTDVTVAIPPKLINSLEDLAKSKFLPIWLDGDPTFLEFKQGLTKAYSDVFKMGPKNRSKTMTLRQFQADHSNLFDTRSYLHTEPLSSVATKYVCKYKSSQVCSGALRIFISKPFSRSAWAYVYSKNTSALTADALKIYANRFLEQSLFGHSFKASDEYFAPRPECENEISKGFEAVEPKNRVSIKLVPWWQTMCALITAMTVLIVENWFAIMTFIFSAHRYFWMQKP